MPDQLEIGTYPAFKHDNVFFAIQLGAAVATRVAEGTRDLCRALGLRGRPIGPERLHATLQNIGRYRGLPEDALSAAKGAAAEVEMPPFDVAFNHVKSFWRERRPLPFVLLGDDGVIGLMMLRQALGNALNKVGFIVDSRYTPHVTLLYDERCITEQTVETVKWSVRHFVLIRSLVGKGVHLTLGRWPLRG